MSESERIQALLERARAEKASFPDAGKRVRVVKGRKLPHGTVGTVVFNGVSRFGRFVTLLVEGREIVVSQSNVEVV